MNHHFKVSAQELLTWRREQLEAGGRRIDLDWLLDIGGGVKWSSLQKLFLDPTSSCSLNKSLKTLEILWRKHLDEHIPLQHLTGCCPWRDFEVEVSSAVMIPRQETELLVDIALKKFEKISLGRWVDLGTGSGALAIALARTLPGWEGHAVDCSEAALLLAKKNLQHLAPDAKVSLHLGSWWQPLVPWWGALSLVLANPPYIPLAEINRLEPVVRDHEPILALSGGEDGLMALREVVSGSLKALKPGGWLMLEHHHDQSEEVLRLMRKAGLVDVDFEKDLHGIRRFALGRNPQKHGNLSG